MMTVIILVTGVNLKEENIKVTAMMNITITDIEIDLIKEKSTGMMTVMMDSTEKVKGIAGVNMMMIMFLEIEIELTSEGEMVKMIIKTENGIVKEEERMKRIKENEKESMAIQRDGGEMIETQKEGKMIQEKGWKEEKKRKSFRSRTKTKKKTLIRRLLKQERLIRGGKK